MKNPYTWRDLCRQSVGMPYLLWWFLKNRVLRFSSFAVALVLILSLVSLAFHVLAEAEYDAVLNLLHQYPWFVKFSWFIHGIFGFAVLIAARHEYSRWKKLRQESFFADSLDLLLDTLDKLTHDQSLSPQEKLTRFTEKMLNVARTSFREKRAMQANFARVCSDNKLRIEKTDPPNASYDPQFSPSLGEGGMGIAAKDKAIVYFPWVWTRNAIYIDFDRTKRPSPLKMSGIEIDLYVKVAPKHTVYTSILTVPVLWEEAEAYGVLNFDSTRRDAFTEIDMKIANIYGQLLGIAFKRLLSHPPQAAATPVP
jgi:hypothetical protein